MRISTVLLSLGSSWSDAIGAGVPCCEEIDLTSQHKLVARNAYGSDFQYSGYVCGKFGCDVDDCCLADSHGNRRYPEENCVPQYCDDAGSDVRGKQITCGGRCPHGSPDACKTQMGPTVVCQVCGNATNANCCGCGYDHPTPICQVGGAGLFLPIGGDAEQAWATALRAILYLLGTVATIIAISSLVGAIFDSFVNLAIQKCNLAPSSNTSSMGRCCSCLEKCCAPFFVCTRIALGIPCVVVSVTLLGALLALLGDLLALLGCVLGVPDVVTFAFWLFVLIGAISSCIAWRSWKLCCPPGPSASSPQEAIVVGAPVKT